MSFMSGIFGGSKGANFNAQNGAVVSPIGPDQAQGGINAANTSLGQYQNFLNALSNQNGLGNQSQVYNQLQGVANGTGPNPAQALLNQQTGQNIANQSALMAGQRGSSANSGLIARQAAQQGAALQQQAVGQGATLQANQSLNALGQAGALANQQAGQLLNAQNTQNNLAQNQESTLLNALNAQNTANINNASQQNQANSSIAKGNQQSQSGILGGALNAAGSGLSLLSSKGGPLGAPTNSSGSASTDSFNSGGSGSSVPYTGSSGGGSTMSNGAGMADGGVVGIQPSTSVPNVASTGPVSNIISHFNDVLGNESNDSNYQSMYKGMSSLGQAFTGQPQQQTQMKAKGGNVGGALKSGGKVPGQAKVKGDSYSNDIVDAKLSPGEVVIPRSVMQSKDPISGAAKFVQAVMAKQGMRR